MKWKIKFLSLLFKGKKERAFALKAKRMPPVLYRYRSFSEHNLKNLESGREWMSLPADFNDVFDGCVTNINRDIDEALVKSAWEANLQVLREAFHIDGIAEMMIHGVNRNLRAKDVHICCFSECIDSSVMWAHYGKNHTGYCVAYDFRMDGKHIFPVFYDQLKSSVIDDRLGDEPASDHYPLLFKDNDWSYELEWRLIHYDLLKVNDNSQLSRMPPAVAVYAGALCTEEQLATLDQHAKMLNVPLYLMNIDYVKRQLFYELV